MRRRRSVYLDDEQWDALTALGRGDDRSVNGVVRLAVAAWIDDHAVGNGLSGATRKQLRQMARAFPPKNPDGTYKDSEP